MIKQENVLDEEPLVVDVDYLGEVHSLSEDISSVNLSSDSSEDNSNRNEEIYYFNYSHPTLCVLMIFQTMDAFKNAMTHHCMLNKFATRTIWSDAWKATLVCAKGNYPWRVHTFLCNGARHYVIKAYDPTHQCSSLLPRNQSMGSSKWVTSLYETWLRKIHTFLWFLHSFSNLMTYCIFLIGVPLH